MTLRVSIPDGFPQTKWPRDYLTENESKVWHYVVDSGNTDPVPQRISDERGIPRPTVQNVLTRFVAAGVIPPKSKGSHRKNRGKSPKADAWLQNGNYASFEGYRREQPRNEEEILAASGADPKVWRVNSFSVTSKIWEVAMKLSENVGTASNPAIEEKPHVQEARLYGVKASFIRIVPKWVRTDLPQVQAVSFTSKPLRLPKRPATALKSAVLLADPHIGFQVVDSPSHLLDPFHDRRVISVWLQILRVVQPDHLVFMGDMMDLPEWGKFLKGPRLYGVCQPAIDETGWLLNQAAAAAPESNKAVLPGNHDDRIRRALYEYLPVGADLRPADISDEDPAALSLEHLWGTKKLGYEVLEDWPDGRLWLSPQLALSHGVETGTPPGAASAKVLRRGAGHSTAKGHDHSLDVMFRTTFEHGGPRVIGSAHCGTAVRLDGRVPKATPDVSWQNGLAVAWWREGDDRAPQIDPILIDHGEAFYQGQAFVGVDYTEQLRSDVQRPWNFQEVR